MITSNLRDITEDYEYIINEEFNRLNVSSNIRSLASNDKVFLRLYSIDVEHNDGTYECVKFGYTKKTMELKIFSNKQYSDEGIEEKITQFLKKYGYRLICSRDIENIILLDSQNILNYTKDEKSFIKK